MVITKQVEESFINALLVDMRMQIDWVIVGFAEEYECKWLTPSHVMSFLKKKYNCALGDIDSNGWEGDMFYETAIENCYYSITGSAYNGGVKFSKQEYEHRE